MIQKALYLLLWQVWEGDQWRRLWIIKSNPFFKPKQINPTSIFVACPMLNPHNFKSQTFVECFTGGVGTGHQPINCPYALEP